MIRKGYFLLGVILFILGGKISGESRKEQLVNEIKYLDDNIEKLE